MENHYQLNNEQFLKAFKNATLPPELFNHEAHLRLAYLLINAYGIDEAIKISCKQIIAYTGLLGASDKFNKTLTVAAVRTVYHFMLKSKTDNFKNFLIEFPRLKHNFKTLLAQHYAVDIYNSEKAKTSFIEPDLLPFD